MEILLAVSPERAAYDHVILAIAILALVVGSVILLSGILSENKGAVYAGVLIFLMGLVGSVSYLIWPPLQVTEGEKPPPPPAVVRPQG